MRIVPFKANTSNRGGVAHKGGVSNYTKLRKELTMVCNSHPHAIISTMFDLNGLPAIDGVDRTDAKQIEEWIHDDIRDMICSASHRSSINSTTNRTG